MNNRGSASIFGGFCMFCLLCICNLQYGYIQAQPALQGEQDLAAIAVGALHESIIIVRLPVFASKEDYAISKLNNDQSSDDPYAAEILAETYAERAILYDAYVRAFSELYDFSKVAFIFSDAVEAMANGKMDPLGPDLKTRIKLDEGIDFFILTLENVDGIDAEELNIRDSELRILQPPFPNGFISGGLAGLFSWFKSEHGAFSQVKRLNKQLWRFYSKTAAERAMMGK